MNSQNYRNQENLEENAFFIKIKTFLNLGIIPQELAKVEVSPVDLTALAIIKLFNQAELMNQNFHVFNPNYGNLLELFSNYKNVNILPVSFDEFIYTILKQLQDNDDTEQIELFMLHQSWLQHIGINSYTTNIVLQDKTETILANLGFKWLPIKGAMLSDIVNKSFKRIKKC